MNLDLAMCHSLGRARHSKDTISATGNMLRNCLAVLFPIKALDTSEKTYSIVPLMAGAGLYETGAGSSAPRHAQQFDAEKHLFWESLGEFLALTVSLEEFAKNANTTKAKMLATALYNATGKLLKIPSRLHTKRMTHTIVPATIIWVCTGQKSSLPMRHRYSRRLSMFKGGKMGLGGYCLANPEKAAAAMRPNETLNAILAV